jgi:polyisoprenoid-binding protein YceI
MTDVQTSLTRTVEGLQVPPAGTYTLDAAHTHVGFVVKHLMISKVRGSFSDVEGTVTIAEDPTQSSVEVRIGAASIDTRDENRENHLRSPDFFDAEQFPSITFRSTAVANVDDDTWEVQGDLTVKDVTRPVTLITTFEGISEVPEALGGGSSIGFSATTKVDREDFDLTWNVPLEKGGVLVGREVTLEIEAEALHQR